MDDTQLVLFTGLGLVILSFLLMLWKESKKEGLCVLLYHRLHLERAPKKGSEALFSISADQFEEHLDSLVEAGFRFLSPQEVIRHLSQDQPFPPKSLLLAFDDGCESVATLAEPLMTPRGISGMVFQTTHEDAFVFHLKGNEQRRCSTAQIKQLVSRGWTWGVHSVHHTPPSSMTKEHLRDDFAQSMSWVERASGQVVEDYAIPGNFMSTPLLAAARESGIKRVWSAVPGVITHPFVRETLPRMGVEGTSNGRDLIHSLSPSGRLFRAALSAAKRAPVQLLGPKMWLPIRRAIFTALSPFSLSRKFWGVVFLSLCLILGILLFP